MNFQADELFAHDEKGQMTFVNDPSQPQTRTAPRFFLGVTQSGFVCRFRHDLPQAVRAQLQSLIDTLSPPTHLQPSLSFTNAIENVLNTHAPIQNIWCGPAYYFPNVLIVSDQIVYIQKHNADLLKPDFVDWIPDIEPCQPFTAFLERGNAVSVCHSVRKTSQAEEAGVDTLETHRGKGYAPLVVAGWAKAVQKEGKIPFYSTSWDNKASQSVAQKLGLIQFGIDYHIT